MIKYKLFNLYKLSLRRTFLFSFMGKNSKKNYYSINKLDILGVSSKASK